MTSARVLMRCGLLAVLMLVAGPASARDGLAGLLACLEDGSAAIVSAHRGGPAPGLPENAIETFAHNRARGVLLFEVDIAKSRDNVLFLMHDRRLERTTTGTGAVAETDWAEIAPLRLEDNDGWPTEFHPPLLSDVLAWAVKEEAFLALDFKGAVGVGEVVAAVAAAEAEDHVMYIAGDLARARDILARDPDAVLSVDAGRFTPEDLLAAGLPPAQIAVWTGIGDFDAERTAAFDRAGFRVNFGTLGFVDSLDDRIAASGDDHLYAVLAAEGLHIVSTDRPLAARAALRAAGRSWDSGARCRP
ncbi:MAG: glycerophosphodiester phosphodiesterase family protein [Rhodothalassiaceae bacterium]